MILERMEYDAIRYWRGWSMMQYDIGEDGV
jgi:hypothetical protein